MKRSLRFRFWLEAGMATVTGFLAVITLAWKDWFEIVFKIDPDGGNGSLEWLIIGVLLLMTLSLFFLARYDWRAARTATSAS